MGASKWSGWWLGTIWGVMGLLGCGPPAPETVREPLRIGLIGNSVVADPHRQNDVVSQAVLGNVFEGLLSFDADSRLEPALAVSWESPDDLTWRFHLRPGVRFHDGRPLGAADVVFSLERARSVPESRTAGYLVGMREVRATGDLTVEILTEAPTAVLANQLTFVYVVPEGSPAEIVEPIGTGPYRWVDADPERGVRLAAFENHWRGPVGHPSAEFRFEPDPGAGVEGLRSGALDLCPLRRGDVEQVRTSLGLRVVSRPTQAVSFLAMRTDLLPFSDLRFRQAVHLAIDRQAMIAGALHGLAEPLGQMVGPGVLGFDPDLVPPRADPDEARRLLAEAGWTDGVDVRLQAWEGSPVEPIVEALGRVGIRVEPEKLSWPELMERRTAGELDFHFGSMIFATGDASDFFDSAVHSRDEAAGYGLLNDIRYSDPSLDVMIEEAAVVFDMDTRRQLFARAMRHLMADLPYVPLYIPVASWGLRDGVEWRPRLDGGVRLDQIQITKR